MNFVFICTIVVFLGLSIFGFHNIHNGEDMMTVQCTIENDNRFLEDSVYGWSGQWSTIVTYTDFWLMLHYFIFAGLLEIFLRDFENTIWKI